MTRAAGGLAEPGTWLVILIGVAFLALTVAMVVWPDRFMRRKGRLERIRIRALGGAGLVMIAFFWVLALTSR